MLRKSLEYRIIMFAFVILFLTTLAITGMDIAGFRRDYEQALVLRTQSIGQAMKASIEKVLQLGLQLRDLPAMTERCRDIVLSNPEISYAVITANDGSVLYFNDSRYERLNLSGSQRSPAVPSTQRIIHEQTSYYNTSIGLKSYDGSIAGYAHVGFRGDAINNKVYGMALRSSAVFVLFFVVSFGCVLFFIKRAIITPIDTLRSSVKMIAEGNYKVTTPPLTSTEFQELGQRIDAMAQALDSRDTALRENYEDLATTHTRLLDSFQKLEELSSQLERSQTLYKTLLEDAGDAIIVLDQQGHIAIANKKAEELLGLAADELLHKHISTILLTLNASDMAHILKLIKDTSSGNFKNTIEETHITTGRHEQIITKMHIGGVQAGNESLLQLLIRDVTTERTLLQNLEKSAAELTRLNQMKDSFLGVASHELKTPLTVIMGYTELLLHDLQQELTPSVQEMTQNISNAAGRLHLIVNDLVDVSMIDRKKLSLNLKSVDIVKLLEQALREHRLFFATRKQTVTLECPSDIPRIQADPDRIIQMLSNLLSNAVKFTPDGGSITVSCRLTTVLDSAGTSVLHAPQSLLQPHGPHVSYLEIAVKDSGIGIDREEQQRVFEKFYEVGNINEHSTGRIAFKSKGTGLGLSIAKGIAQMHGGVVWVESIGYNPDTCPGSTFFVLLPLDPQITDGTIAYNDI